MHKCSPDGQTSAWTLWRVSEWSAEGVRPVHVHGTGRSLRQKDRAYNQSQWNQGMSSIVCICSTLWRADLYQLLFYYSIPDLQKSRNRNENIEEDKKWTRF